MWVKGKGFPSRDFFRALHPSMENVIGTKVPEEYYPLGARAGSLTAEWAKKTGLREGTPVAIGNVDAHGLTNVAGARTAGLPVSGYHFFSPLSSSSASTSAARATQSKRCTSPSWFCGTSAAGTTASNISMCSTM